MVTTIERVVATAAILTALGTIIAKAKEIYRGVKMAAGWIRDRWSFHSRVLQSLESNRMAIESVQSELRPNGGTSLRDAVNELRDMSILANIRAHLTRDTCPYPMYECDTTGKCVWVNEALCTLFGLPEEEMLEQGWLRAIEDSDRIRVVEAWNEALRRDIPYSDVYHVVNQRTGEKYRCRTRAASYKANGKIVLYAGTVTREKESPHG